MSDRTIEILAPAGSYTAFQAALHAGADAVYAGGTRFGARAFADNFTEEEMIRAIHEAHFFGRRLYMTVNTLLKESETEGLYDYLLPYYENGLDAVIVQDFGVVEFVRKYFPDLDIHASTQMTVTDVYGARFARDCGMTRVVPARELSLEEIRQIRKGTDLEIECFVHGALCYCYSGQCLLSSMIGGRSGNRGRCAQPCRLPYTFDAAAGQGKQYYLSPKDICTLDLIPDLIEAGIDSFKIEGRMKSPQYVAGVTAMYRKYSDLYLQNGREKFRVQPEDREMLMDLYNRGGFSDGYYRTRNGRQMISLARPNHAGVPAAKVKHQNGREVLVYALTDLSAGDVLEIAGEKNDHTLGSAVRKGQSFSFLVRKNVRLQNGQILSRIRNGSLLKQIDENIISDRLQRPVEGELTLRIGAPAVLRISSGGHSFTARSSEPVQHALNRPLTEDRIRSQINKTGNSMFCFSRLDVTMDPDIFMPVQQLSGLRRDAFSGLEAQILSDDKRPSVPAPAAGQLSVPQDDEAGLSDIRFSIYVETEEQLQAAAGYVRQSGFAPARIYLGTGILTGSFSDRPEELRRILQIFRQDHSEIFAALPYVLRSTEYPVLEKLLSSARAADADGLLIRNCGEYQFLREHGFDKKMILDHNLYVFNHYACDFWKSCGVTEYTVPLEQDEDEPGFPAYDNLEMEVYGAEPVMVSAQCLFKTADTCRKTSPVSVLTDRKGKHFPVRAHCDFCYNVIYNSRPRRIIKGPAAGLHRRAQLLRIRFSTETAAQVTDVLKQYMTD